MNIDIRLSLGFLDHPKTIKLQKRCGFEGIICLERLWLWAAANRPNGVLSGMDAEDIESAARWVGDEGTFFSALLGCRWIDETDDGYILHGWEEHQAYASKSEERREKARKAINARWEKQREQQQNTDSDTTSILNDTTSINENTFSNSPKHQNTNTPKHQDINTPLSPHQGESRTSVSPARKTPAYPEDFETFWREYPKKTGKDAALRAWLNKKREKRLPDLPELIPKLQAAKQSDQWQRDGGQYIPNPSTWINQARWLDEEIQETTQREPLFDTIWDDR